jgi:hypothetical protein
MSLLDDLFNLGRSAYEWYKGDSLGASVARTAVTGYALRKVTSSINKDNNRESPVDAGVRVQVDPDTNYKIPVVYGTAIIGGTVTDAYMSPDNKTMWFVITLCEATGEKLSDSQLSEISFDSIYWNGQQVQFFNDGITAAALLDQEGNQDTKIANLVKFYLYSGNVSYGVKPAGFTGVVPDARNVMPSWNANHIMNELVFAIVQVEYNREAGFTSLGKIDFKLKNNMTQPGDCLYDYMTNTRYGAGLLPEEINGI